MIHVANNSESVGEIKVDRDPRFGHISNSALIDFARGIGTNFYLSSLEIRNVELGNAFLSTLAESIRTNWTLETIDLRDNHFTSDALVDFCLAMKRNKALRSVDLRSQHSPIHSQQEKAVLEALFSNNYVEKFQVEFRSEKCQKFVDELLSRNKKKGKTIKDREAKILECLSKEADRAEKEMKQRDKEEQEANNCLENKDCDYFYELATLAKMYRVDLTKTDDDGSANPSVQNFCGPSSSSKLGKSLNFPATRMTADGSFLNDEYISTFLVEDGSVLTFEFTNQFKLFKRFAVDDPARQTIVEKFVAALIAHPRSNDINVLNMANTCIKDDILDLLCTRCLAENKMKNVHQMNLETNFLSGKGFISLAKCISSTKVWRYLNTVKVDNQKSPVRTDAEVAIAKALCVNRTVIRFSLRVRNLRERERINRYVQRNIDFLRQARQLHNKKTGKVVKRARNKMEQKIDAIAANDASVSGEVSIVGDQLFLALHRTEIMKAASCFAGNQHVTSLKMCLLKLDDEFATELAKSIKSNSTIEKLVLDNNSIGTEGVTAIVASLANNKSITELQIRHQSKPLSTTDEEKLAGLLSTNETLVKFGVDLRSTRARNEVDRKMRQNQEKRRKNRAANKGSLASSSSHDKVKSNKLDQLFKSVIGDDEKVTEVIISDDAEFLEMSASRKKEFLEGLTKNTHVKKLTLEKCRLDNGFAEDIAKCLASNKTLKELSFSGNDFTSPGVLTIAKAATKNKKIKHLAIKKPRFKITESDAEIFLEEMEKKSSLRALDIEFRNADHQKRVEAALKNNSK